MRHTPKKAGPRALGRRERAATTDYLERAALLWARFDRANLRRVADDPGRVAESVQRRTP